MNDKDKARAVEVRRALRELLKLLAKAAAVNLSKKQGAESKNFEANPKAKGGESN